MASTWASKGVRLGVLEDEAGAIHRHCVKSRAGCVREIKGRSGNRGAGGKSEERMGNQEEYLPNPLNQERETEEREEGEGGGNSWAHGGSGIPDHGDPTRLCLFSRPTPRISRRWSRAPPLTNVLCPLGWSTALCGPPLWSPLVHDCNTACNSFSSLSFPMICCSARASLPSTLLHVLALLYHLYLYCLLE